MSADLESEIRAVVSSTGTVPIANTRQGKSYQRITDAGSLSRETHRWIGKCQRCGATHRVEGVVRMGSPGVRGDYSDYVIDDGSGSVLYQQTPNQVSVLCGDHTARLEWVVEGKKKSKHVCGARCTNATGPSCDCRCKGMNHGKNC